MPKQTIINKNTIIEIINNADVARSELETCIDRALWAIGATAEGYAKRLCPVDTGRLRNSITHVSDGESAYIGTNVEYASFVELGTSKMHARPYLKPAATQHSDEYKRIAEASLKAGA